MADFMISLAEAAKRLKIGQVEVATTWAARHGVELAYDGDPDGDGGKVIGLRREQFEQALDPVDSEVRDLLSGERRQRKERERSRDDVQRHIRATLEGDRRPEPHNDDRDRIPNLVGEGGRSKSKPSKGDLLLRLIGTQNEESSLKPKSKPDPSEPGSGKDVEDVKRWLKL